MYNPYSLQGKTILITGASSGIGRATAIECSKLGGIVILTGRNSERLKETFDLLDRSFDQKHKSFIADLTSEDDIAKLVDEVDNLDGIVNNAGVNRIKPVSFIKSKDLEYIFHNNTFPSVALLQCLLKRKKINKGASIVFTSSVSAIYNAPGRALYASSKAAINSFMRSFAIELADKGIRANCVMPGMVETGLVHENLTEDEIKVDLYNYPLKRYGTPEEIAWAIIYLLSPASSWVTGTNLTIDGGFMLK